ncbi:single-stranded DNA-binding protein [Nonomuraea sp. NPDC002799]
MNDIYITLTGNVAAEPRQYSFDEGSKVTSLKVLTSHRYFDKRTGQWTDGEKICFTVRCWRALGDNVAASIRAGHPVVVSGKLRIREFGAEGDRRFMPEIEASAVGHDLRWGTGAFTKPDRSGGVTSMSKDMRDRLDEETQDWAMGTRSVRGLTRPGPFAQDGAAHTLGAVRTSGAEDATALTSADFSGGALGTSANTAPTWETSEDLSHTMGAGGTSDGPSHIVGVGGSSEGPSRTVGVRGTSEDSMFTVGTGETSEDLTRTVGTGEIPAPAQAAVDGETRSIRGHGSPDHAGGPSADMVRSRGTSSRDTTRSRNTTPSRGTARTPGAAGETVRILGAEGSESSSTQNVDKAEGDAKSLTARERAAA